MNVGADFYFGHQSSSALYTVPSRNVWRESKVIVPDDKPDEHIVPVKIEADDTVADLKELIKDKHAPMLDKVAARNLIFWKCSGLPDDDDLKQTLKTIWFNGSDDRLVRLNKARQANFSA